jgi:hypothetical protein
LLESIGAIRDGRLILTNRSQLIHSMRAKTGAIEQ